MQTFHAMNTQVTVWVPHVESAVEHDIAVAIAKQFADIERRFSRFLPRSELSELNRATTSVAVSTEMIELLRACSHHVADTGGIFDPTVGAALCAAGYDRSFAPGALDRAQLVDTPTPASFAEVNIDEAARIVQRPPHVVLDFGGLVKGRTVDEALHSVSGSALIDAGGDIAVRGDGPDGNGWLIDIEDPESPERVLATLRVRDRAVATSASNRRRWRTGPHSAHHLIDPRTSMPSSSDLLQVSVVAPSAELADVYAKTAFVLGSRDGRTFLADRGAAGIAGVLVARDAIDYVGEIEVVDA